MIEMKNVCFTYQQESTLKNISFHIGKGEFVALIGSNGAGKSTLSKLMNGLLKPSSGIVTVSGMDTKKTKSSVLAKHIGFLFQNPDRQICKNTVAEEIRFGLDQILQDKVLIQQRVDKMIADFRFDPSANPFALSRGERQQLALASVIAAEPEILVLDEPTTGLDFGECSKIMGFIQQLNRQGTTVIMVCHDMEVVLDFAKRILVLSEGRLLADGDTKEIFRLEDILKQASVLPPQIAQLALRLGSGFEKLFTVEEMAKALRERTKPHLINEEGRAGHERFSGLCAG
ncbi:MAG: ATP-binding cassette domain-containing protein [Thermoclostridium sp.]|nr:ATP-binding cassette domain-containing protein [Thermoclostridium sp.]